MSAQVHSPRRMELCLWPIGVMIAAIVINFLPVFLLKLSFLTGDDVEQHIPWAAFLGECLRHFKWPLWTMDIHSGFPLLAEGQIGAFYPFNVFFSGLLPVQAAFNYSILFHYILGGGLFYLYAVSLGLSPWPALFSTLAYLFGAANGGLFYNVTSQKVVIWFPLTLYLVDRMLWQPRYWLAGWLGIVLALQVFAGYLQVAIYSFAMTGFYFLFFAAQQYVQDRDMGRLLATTRCCAFAGVFFLLVACPQWVSTIELSRFSPRTDLNEAFAYVGSASPLVFATVFFPGWDGILDSGPGLYIGIIGLFFLLFSLFGKKSRKEIFFMIFFILTMALALGKYSPLYVVLVKLSGFHGFRVPAKFLFFSNFSLAILAGFGFEKALNLEGERARSVWQKCLRVLSGLTLTVGAGWLAVNGGLRLARERILEWGKSYIQTHIYGQEQHPHSLEFYQAKLESVYGVVLRTLSPVSYETGVALLTILGSVVALGFITAKGLKPARWKGILLMVLFADLYFYGFTAAKFGLRDFSKLTRPSPVIDFLKHQDGFFRIHEFDENPMAAEKNFPVFPNYNMFLHFSDAGAYSPFVLRDYRDFLKGLGGVNDSLVPMRSDREALAGYLPLLSRLNVKYILSRSPLSDPRLIRVFEEKKEFIYQNQNVFPRAYFVTRYQRQEPREKVPQIRERIAGLRFDEILLEDNGAAFPPSPRRIFEEVPIKPRGQDEVSIHYQAPENGFLVLSVLHYPGWQVKVNGKKRNLLKANGVLQAVHLEKGEGDVQFRFLPGYFHGTLLLSLVSLAGFLVFPFFFRP